MRPTRFLEEAHLAPVFATRFVHDTTREPITAVSCTAAQPLPPGWSLATSEGRVVVCAWDPPPALANPIASVAVHVTVTDPTLRDRLAAPDPTINLTDLVTVFRFVPSPSVVEVALASSVGQPVTGKAVRLRGTAGADIALAEVAATPGTYRSPATAWTNAFAKPSVVVDNVVQLEPIALDPSHSTNRFRLVA